MAWFIVWMLLTADEPMRDGGMSCDERDYIVASLTSTQQVSHVVFLCFHIVCPARQLDR